MKKVKVMLALALSTILFSACGNKEINQEQYSDVVVEKNYEVVSELQNQNEELSETETTILAEIETLETVESETIAETETETQIELTEEEYKQNCQEMFYDDVFFGEDDLENQYVKLDLFLNEKQIFTTDAMLYSDTWKQYNDKYNLKRDLYKASVKRKDEDSYFGKGNVQLWFAEEFDLDANDYKSGQKIIMYGQVIAWSNNTWDGYNSVTIIPKYIESK